MLCGFLLVFLGCTLIAGINVYPFVSVDAFGAEVINVDLNDVTNDEFLKINEWLLRYKVLVIKDQQDLTVDGQRAFSGMFGKLLEHLETSSHFLHYKDVNLVSNVAHCTINGTAGLSGQHVENYHSDLSWADLPTKITFLKADLLPVAEGDTYFSDSTAAFYALDESFKKRVLLMDGYYSYMKYRSTIPGLSVEADKIIRKGSIHPLISTHPVTGRKNIFANIAQTVSVKGFMKEESDKVLDVLFKAVDNEKHIYIHKWSDGDLVMWDNRACQHKATKSKGARRLIRTTVLNDTL